MIQKCLIQYILSPMGRMMEKLSAKTRDTLFVLAGLGIVLHLFAENMSLAKYRFLIFYVVGCLLLGVMILCTVSKDMKPVKFRWPLAICWFGVGVTILISGLTQNVDYMPEAVLFLVAFPVLFICWNNCDRIRIFRLLLLICKISLVIFILGSFLLTDITAYVYPGIFNNTNGAAYYLAVCCICLLVELIYEKHFGAKYIANTVLLGMAVALMYYTNSRTGPLGAAVALAGGLAVYILTHSRKENIRCLIRLAIAAVVAVILVLNLVYVFQLRQKLDFPISYNPEIGQFTVEMRESGEAEPGKKPSTNKKDEFFNISGFNTIADQKGSVGDKTMDQYSTGRISIWMTYVQDLNWLGHAEMPKIYIDMLYKSISTAHMTILQVAYESGIPAGIFYFLLNIGSGLAAIWFAWRNRGEKFALMPLMITLGFGVLSMLGSCNVSFWYMTTLYYYLVQFPIIASCSAGEGRNLKAPEVADVECTHD